MTTDTLAKLAAELAQLASEGPELIHLQSGAYISQKLSEAAKALEAQALPADARTPSDFAIEHGGYLANSADRLLTALNDEDEAHMAINELDSDDCGFAVADQAHTEAIEQRNDAVQALRSRIHEFRKRADRATTAQQAAQAHCGRCDECGKGQPEGWALYCVGCLEKTGLLAKEALPNAQHVSSTAADLTGPNDTAAQATTGAPSEPFGYFKAEPFGWTDCAETDDGAVALYERPQQAAQAPAGWPASLTTASLKQSVATMESAAAHLGSLPKMHQGKLLAHDLRRAAGCCETALAALPQPPQPQSAQPEVTK